MDAQQIYSILKSDEVVNANNFLGCFPLDLIPISALKHPCCLVINTKPQNHPGEHWVAVIKSENNRGIYFDSYGIPPYNLPEIEEILNECESWKFNNIALQSPFSAVCGQYVIFFLTHITRGYSLDHIVYLLNDTGDQYANDAFIYQYIKDKYIDDVDSIKKLKIIDIPFIFTQISKTLS